MKNTLIFIVIAIISIGLGFVASSHYDAYRQEQSRAAAAERGRQFEQAQKLEKATKDRESALKTVSQLKAECQKGIEAYNSLSTANKNRLESPSCE